MENSPQQTTIPRSPKENRSMIEKVFEQVFWNTRYLVMFGVFSSLIAAFILFAIGTLDMIGVVKLVWNYYVYHDTSVDVHGVLIGSIIGAVDIFLIAVVLLIFSFGLYELFISKLEPATDSEISGILQIKSLDALKDKIAQVIVMALVVKYFQLTTSIKFTSAVEMIYLASSIFALALALYFLHKSKH